MKKVKYAIIILIFLIITVIILLYNINKKETNSEVVQDEPNLEKYIEKTEDVLEYEEALTVQECIQNYISNMYGPENILELLDQNFINKNGINIENLFDKIRKIEPLYNFNAKRVYKKHINSKITQYYMSGRLVNSLGSEDELSNVEKEIVYFSVLLNKFNKSFSIIPYTSEQAKKEEGIDIPILYLDDDLKNYTIQKNSINTYYDDNIPTIQDEIEYYFNQYIYEIDFFLEDSYYLLENQYRNTRFKNIEEYKNSINNIIDVQSFNQLDKYSINNFDGYNQFVCKYNGDKTIIINKYSALNYRIILDTYSINLPNFTQKYNKASEQEKVVMNIERIFSAINNKDYNFVYNYLDEDFKRNYFKNVNEFAKHIESNLYKSNTVNYEEFSTQGELFIYNIKIKNQEKKSDIEKEMTIIMKLKEGTDFVMSFSLN